MTFKEFIEDVKKVTGPRHHRVKNSYGVLDAYRYYKESKYNSKKCPLTREQFRVLIRAIHKEFANILTRGEDVILPCRMGRLEIRKYTLKLKIVNGKVEENYPVDWGETLKLWYEDEESYKNKTLVKNRERERYKVYYNRVIATFKNKTFYEFNVNRDLNNRLRQVVKNNEIDAFNIK